MVAIPVATQLPAVGQDTAPVSKKFSLPVPASVRAACQVPFFSSASNTWRAPLESV